MEGISPVWKLCISKRFSFITLVNGVSELEEKGSTVVSWGKENNEKLFPINKTGENPSTTVDKDGSDGDCHTLLVGEWIGTTLLENKSWDAHSILPTILLLGTWPWEIVHKGIHNSTVCNSNKVGNYLNVHQ